MIAWGLGIYLAGILLGYFGPPLYPKLYHRLHEIFDGDAPFVPYGVLLTFWPLLLPLYLAVYLIAIPVIKLGDLHDHILEWSENRALNKAQQQEAEEVQEQRNRTQYADKYL